MDGSCTPSPSATSNATGFSGETASPPSVSSTAATISLLAGIGVMMATAPGSMLSPKSPTRAKPSESCSCAHTTGFSPFQRLNSNRKNSPTMTIGPPHVSNRGGAGCNSRPQYGQITSSEVAELPQRRHRTFFGFVCNASPHSGHTLACAGTPASQLGHLRVPVDRKVGTVSYFELGPAEVAADAAVAREWIGQISGLISHDICLVNCDVGTSLLPQQSNPIYPLLYRSDVAHRDKH